MTGSDIQLSETPLVEAHVGLGARIIEFAGWRMPVQYRGILEEHRAVRERAGLFDLSHMGELFVDGSEAADALAYALVSDPTDMAVGRGRYTMICTPDGGVIDDLIVYRLAAEQFLVVANAANAGAVSDALAERSRGFKAVVDDRSLATALVAIQGPLAESILAPLVEVDLAEVRYYRVVETTVGGVAALVARTGYTGEDGFEIFIDWAQAHDVWARLLEVGEPAGLLPCGLGARDTLRLEAGMPLYGNELDVTTNPFEAGLGRIVDLERSGDFVGRAALERIARDGVARRLVGLVLQDRGIARHGYPVLRDERRIGQVTSGAPSPSLGTAIAMAYVPPADAEPGTIVDVEIREQRVPAEVVALPFYRRPR